VRTVLLIVLVFSVVFCALDVFVLCIVSNISFVYILSTLD